MSRRLMADTKITIVGSGYVGMSVAVILAKIMMSQH